MLLHRIHLDPRCREARRDLSDPYQLHSTICRAFCEQDQKCPDGEILWRHEPEIDAMRLPCVLVQSRSLPSWTRIGVRGWLAKVDRAIDLKDRLRLDSLQRGQRFRFRLRANPCVTRQGKRVGLLRLEEQERWIERQGERHGFSLPKLASFDLEVSPQQQVDVRISEERMLRGKQRDGNGIRIYSALYDGVLIVVEPDKFTNALRTGVGHGKVMGLGLLSVAPIA